MDALPFAGSRWWHFKRRFHLISLVALLLDSFPSEGKPFGSQECEPYGKQDTADSPLSPRKKARTTVDDSIAVRVSL